MSDEVVRVAAGDAELEADPLDPGQILEGDPRTSALVLRKTPDGAESGIWRCTPGRFRDTETAEAFVVLEGKATIEWAGGTIDVGAGDLCHLAAGTETVWTVHETLLKRYSIFHAHSFTRTSSLNKPHRH
jgi:uncharacterized cupin superfamily protein